MIKKLEFNCPEEESEFSLANDGVKFYCCLLDIQQKIRKKLKHGDLNIKEEKIYNELEEFFYETLEDRGVNLDDYE